MQQFKKGVLLFTILFGSLLIKLSGQTRVVIGTLEPNHHEWTEKQTAPLTVIGHFEKTKYGWQTLADSAGLPQKLSFNIFYNNKKLGAVQTRYNKALDTTFYAYNWYKITGGTAPKVGTKSTAFSGWPSYAMYRPLVAGTAANYRQKKIIKKGKGTQREIKVLDDYLKQKAAELNLGEIPRDTKQIIQNVSALYTINDSCYLAEATVNLNIYCFIDKVPFADVTENSWNTVEKMIVQNPGSSPVSKKVMFLVKGNTVKIIGRNLTFLDSGDYDNDGYDEIIFKKQVYNWDSYIMIINKYSDFIENGWGYN